MRITTALPRLTVPDLAAVPAQVPGQQHDGRRLDGLLADFEPTTLSQLEGVSLLNRVDTKYVLSAAQVEEILPTLTDQYRMLEIEGRRLHQYRTLYFDTPDFALYRRHHDGRAVRHKVRSRAYVDTGLAYFEVKARNNRGRTVKRRVKTDTLLTDVTPAARALLTEQGPSDEQPVEPKLRNDFVRITLAGKTSAERLTLDLGVRFEYDGRAAILPGAAIAELKQSGIDYGSPFIQRMRTARLHPTSISKYCVGVALLVPDVKHNAFREKLRTLDKATGGAIDVR